MVWQWTGIGFGLVGYNLRNTTIPRFTASQARFMITSISKCFECFLLKVSGNQHVISPRVISLDIFSV